MSPNAPTSFLTLPYEIRRMVYTHYFSLPTPNPNIPRSIEPQPWLNSPQNRPSQALLLISASTLSIANEARQYLFSSLQFRQDFREPLITDFIVLNHKIQVGQYIRSIGMCIRIDRVDLHEELANQLARLQNLPSLKILKLVSVTTRNPSQKGFAQCQLLARLRLIRILTGEVSESSQSRIECRFDLGAICTPCTKTHVLWVPVSGGQKDLEGVIRRLGARVSKVEAGRDRPCGKCGFETSSSNRWRWGYERDEIWQG